MPGPATACTAIENGRKSSWMQTQVRLDSRHESGMVVDRTSSPSSGASVITSLRAFCLRGSIQIQKLRLSAGEDSVLLTKIEACTGRSESPATAGMDATRTRHTANMSGRHARNRRGVSWARIIDSTCRVLPPLRNKCHNGRYVIHSQEELRRFRLDYHLAR